MDERYLETIPEVESMYSRQSRRSSIATTALPELPFRAVAPLQPSQAALDADRTSSVYSQPSPVIPDDIQEESAQGSDSVRSEISPLSTPRASVDHLPVSPIISPVDAQFSQRYSKPDTQYKSQIPRRKVPDTNAGSVASTTEYNGATSADADKKQDTKWDDYSGEPSATGKDPVVRPGAQPLEVQYPQLKERTRQILAGLRERDSAKKQAWGRVPPPVDSITSLDNPPVQREPWRGASGRTAMVEPVRNTPSARLEPLRIPQRNISLENAAPSSAPVNSTKETSPHISSPRPAIPSSATIRTVESQESIRPTPPLKLGATSPRVRSPVTVENMAALKSPFQVTNIPSDQSIHDAVTTPKAPQNNPDGPNLPMDDLSTPTTPMPQNVMQPVANMNQDGEAGARSIPKDQTSRFSWTTYATTVNESPRSMAHTSFDDSPIPPMPTIPSPIMIRKRPVASVPSPYSNMDATVSNASIVSRKPLPADRHRASSLMTTATLTKSLPQCPPEMEAMDKISTLEARMDDLARRKRNIGKIIKEMTDRLRRNSISYDVRKRKEVEKMVTNLKLEMAEVSQEEYEVGIRLHRAQKKRDKDDNYEQPTGLWVKRVTS